MGKSGALINLLVALGPLALGACFVVVSAMGLVSSAVTASVASLFGVGLLVAAKLPAFRAGRWTSFGPSGLPARNRRLYFGAWALIIIAFLLWIGIASFVRA